MMAGFYSIKVEVDGRTCRGEWGLTLDGQLCVRCAWGRLTVPLCGRRRRPEAWAQIILTVLVRCYEKRREEHRAWQEREAARLGRRRRSRAVFT